MSEELEKLEYKHLLSEFVALEAELSRLNTVKYRRKQNQQTTVFEEKRIKEVQARMNVIRQTVKNN